MRFRTSALRLVFQLPSGISADEQTRLDALRSWRDHHNLAGDATRRGYIAIVQD